MAGELPCRLRVCSGNLSSSCHQAHKAETLQFRFTRILSRLLRRLTAPAAVAGFDLDAADAATVDLLRARGVQIGQGCRIYTLEFSTEPYLVSLGDRVGVSGGVKFLTHDGVGHLLRRQRPMIQFLGRIEVGNDCFIGENAVLLPGTRLGDGCIVGAGAVVRGDVPVNSLVAGNPARVVGRASLLLKRLEHGGNALDTFGLPEAERRQVIERHFGLKGGN
jgi:acetyltransferase-like isoleucine patch superfamily enzyme